MFMSWGKEGDDGEKNLLAKRFKWYEYQYDELIDKLMKVKEKARQILIRLSKKKVSNCKILAKRVNQFQIQNIGEELKVKTSSMYYYLKTSHAGFYCAICDAAKVPFINIEEKTITLGEGFCRNMIDHGLHVLFYYHVLFVKYLNLVSTFVTSCEFNGTYSDKLIPEDFMFESIHDHHKMFNQCNDKVNDINWFENCMKVCSYFNFVKFNHFFAPNVHKFGKLSIYLKEQLDRLDKEEEKEKLLEEPKHASS